MAGNTEEGRPPVGAPAAQGQAPRSAAGSGQAAEAPQRMITSEELLRGGSEVVIHHGGENYRLRRTSKGKLILTK